MHGAVFFKSLVRRSSLAQKQKQASSNTPPCDNGVFVILRINFEITKKISTKLISSVILRHIYGYFYHKGGLNIYL